LFCYCSFLRQIDAEVDIEVNVEVDDVDEVNNVGKGEVDDVGEGEGEDVGVDEVNDVGKDKVDDVCNYPRLSGRRWRLIVAVRPSRFSTPRTGVDYTKVVGQLPLRRGDNH
jgi:hypothetical protein